MTTMIPEIYAALIELGAPEEMAWSAAETLIRQLPADKVAMLRECALRRMVEDQLSDLRYACQGHSIEWPAELDNSSPSDRRAVGCPGSSRGARQSRDRVKYSPALSA